jgi:hypothetical protein
MSTLSTLFSVVTLKTPDPKPTSRQGDGQPHIQSLALLCDSTLKEASISPNIGLMPVLEGYVAVVAGDNRGVGRVMALAMARAGASAARTESSLSEAAAEVEARGSLCDAVRGGRRGFNQRSRRRVLAGFGTADVVVLRRASPGQSNRSTRSHPRSGANAWSQTLMACT